jgi:hypothetical protein
VAPGGHWQANRSSNENHSLLALVNAARLAALGYFTVTGRIPQPWLASTASAVTAEISQNINSPRTGE